MDNLAKRQLVNWEQQAWGRKGWSKMREKVGFPSKEAPLKKPTESSKCPLEWLKLSNVMIEVG